MHLSSDISGRQARITALFRHSFTASEGAGEGAAVSALAQRLLATTSPEDLRVFHASEGAEMLGCIMFSRLRFAGDAPVVFLLSPVAVRPTAQSKGLGQRLMHNGLGALRDEGVVIAVTYGDPRYYAKTGFAPVSTSPVPPPYPLSQPAGWLANSLDGGPVGPLQGPSRAVDAFDDPALW